MRSCAFILSFALLSLLVSRVSAQVEQIDFQRVELMPNEPAPYNMRDWSEVAMGYDSFVYDITKTGLYLPLVFLENGFNYPERSSFGLDTYVGTVNENNGEAINVLPSLVGATLVGIDKTNQFGQNWILMSQDYFNRVNGENLYLNNIGGHSGGDWWYDMMPNVYFYQLYDLYGNMGDAEYQFETIADKMDAAVRIMGGKATPWTRAFMDYRAFDFLNMQPNPQGVHEPEAAGAFAWLLYHAYKENGDLSHLQAAEWSMEYLVNLNSNPSYELMLPYGAYAAAKMNAEIGTEYNVEKLLFWVFNRGPLRGWGTIVGTWNGYDVSGLVGEANDAGNDYAFQLNGVQQAGALVPLVRYDKRFARAIGKWLLNVANATRLMFPGFLPDQLQDASAWSDVYDPEGVIGYEALREMWQGNEPFATGDALKGGWAATNLSLYSTSSIGYLGSMLERTDDEKILKVDLLKTDFFSDEAYPSYLLFNPYTLGKTVTINVGTEAIDIYEALSEDFIAQDVSGDVQIYIPADQAISIVLAPANGELSYENNKTLIDGVVVDFLQTTIPYNYPPRIQALAVENTLVKKNTTVTIYGKGIDQETKDLIYTFFLPDDTISSLEKTVEWTAPDEEGVFQIKLVVEDENQQTDTAVLFITVVEEINIAPEIISVTPSTKFATFGQTIHFDAEVADQNGDSLSYTWLLDVGIFLSNETSLDWTAPNTAGIRTIRLQVSDGRGGTDVETVRIAVLDTMLQQSGEIIAWYPFAGSASDISGNELHGSVFGARLVPDSLGNPNQAYFFDGINDHIRVPNESILNFTSGITISLYARPDLIGDKERFIISHGSYQNRYKISITPEGKVRWTIKNELGQISDLDSETILEEGKYYHIAVTYDAWFMMLYINGHLETFTTLAGNMNISPLALEIGQQFPDDPSYNFRGVLDEIKIWNYALWPYAVGLEGGVITSTDEAFTDQNKILVYPNPASDWITIDLQAAKDILSHDVNLTISDLAGKLIYSTTIEDSMIKKINVSSFTPGMHFIRITDGTLSMTKEFIIK